MVWISDPARPDKVVIDYKYSIQKFQLKSSEFVYNYSLMPTPEKENLNVSAPETATETAVETLRQAQGETTPDFAELQKQKEALFKEIEEKSLNLDQIEKYKIVSLVLSHSVKDGFELARRLNLDPSPRCRFF